METAKERVKKVRGYLDRLYENAEQVKNETIAKLGEREAVKIIDFHANNWIDVEKWIYSEYKEKSKQSAVVFYFTSSFKEMYWLELLFLSGNYPAVYRNLRYIWEAISRAYVVDNIHPEWSLDDKIDGLWGLEKKKKFGWRLIKFVLADVFQGMDENGLEEFHQLWDYLNRHVHPSVITLDEIFAKDPASFVTDSFHEGLAKECLAKVDAVMGIVFSIVVKTFPRIARHAKQFPFIEEWHEVIPQTYKLVQKG